ncbi:16S rRNA (guanine(527)-N(7))-methyltransferase RsmG [Nocardia sp. NPDC050175]|uniref:16S rRNA (guanine(527)-N(7))-methyltransferase RsmG n=1 Tax=Nocardia sp. NPDC050175 TaxID=3364317 RepID=UPI0037888011
MFHVERDLGETTALPAELAPPASAAVVFGDRLDLARRYCAALATAGVERGLIGPREVPRLWDRHILNCAVIGELIAEGASVVDIGSGAGLPGIPLAIARPDLRITLVEPLLRRTIFLSEFIEAAGLDVTVVRGRAEQSGVLKEAGGADVVTSRAVAPLGKLAQWSLPLLRDHGRMLALKGVSAAEELARDGEALERAGAGNATVVECGAGIVSTPTLIISAERLPRAERAPRRRSEQATARREAKAAKRAGADAPDRVRKSK